MLICSSPSPPLESGEFVSLILLQAHVKISTRITLRWLICTDFCKSWLLIGLIEREVGVTIGMESLRYGNICPSPPPIPPLLKMGGVCNPYFTRLLEVYSIYFAFEMGAFDFPIYQNLTPISYSF